MSKNLLAGGSIRRRTMLPHPLRAACPSGLLFFAAVITIASLFEVQCFQSSKTASSVRFKKSLPENLQHFCYQSSFIRTPASSASVFFCLDSIHFPGPTFGTRSLLMLPIPPSFVRFKSQLASSFYDDFEDFGELGSGKSGNETQRNSESNDKFPDGDEVMNSSDDDAVMRSLRERMKDLSKQNVENDDDDDDEEDENKEHLGEDFDSGSALSDLKGSSISSVDDLIGFAQAKAREKSRKSAQGSEGNVVEEIADWANPIPHKDEITGELLDLNGILKGGVILLANPAKFCSDLAGAGKNSNGKGNKNRTSNNGGLNMGSLFDPFPSSLPSQSPPKNISPALLAKFGLTLPPPPDLGPDRRADLLPVLLLIDRNPLRGCQAVLMNRRTGYLLGDLERQNSQGSGSGGDIYDDNFPPPPPRLGAFMIQPLWFGGTSPGGGISGSDGEDLSNSNGNYAEERKGNGSGGLDMLHKCPLVDGSIPLAKSDGLYWGGDPVQAQEVMNDARLEKPLSGFDFKFFVQSTRWLPAQLEKEIRDETWYVATVSKEVLFKSRDRLGSKRAKPLWTEIMDLLGDDYKKIRDQLYGGDGDDDKENERM